MRKVFVSFLIIVICFVFTGAVVPKESNQLDTKKETILPTTETVAQKETVTNTEENSLPTEKTKNTEENTENVVIEESETLSAEDKALKAEIAKISDTKIDFRTAKQDKIGAKTYAMKFKEFANTSGKDPRIVYTFLMDNGEEAKFTYHLNNGKLLEVAALTGGYKKTEQSITFEEAQKIAVNIAKQYCDTSVYQISEAKEWYQFYQFIFTREISGYETCEGIFLNLDFNGHISYMRICLDVFANKDFTVDEEKMTTALEKYLTETSPNCTGYEIDKQRICVSNGKAVMEYYTVIKFGDSNSNEIIQIPIE